MSDWKPIADAEFSEFFRLQYGELTPDQRKTFEIFRVPFWKALIRRSDMYGDEAVFVVCQKNDGVLYFDDVEYGFNISTIDSEGRILQPGGSTYTLKEAVEHWLPTDSNHPEGE